MIKQIKVKDLCTELENQLIKLGYSDYAEVETMPKLLKNIRDNQL